VLAIEADLAPAIARKSSSNTIMIARQRIFQCCLSTLGPYDDPVCILITLYHSEAHSTLHP
jgi:hypothetical protein